MPHFFEKRDRWGNGLGLWVLLAMAFSLPLSIWGISQLTLVNDVDRWLSDNNLPKRQFDWYQTHFPAEESCLVTWEDSTLDDPRLERLAAKLTGTPDERGIARGGVPQVALVRTPGQLVHRMQQLKLDRSDAIERLHGVLLGQGRVWVQLTANTMNQKARVMRLLRERAKTDLGLELTLHEPVTDIGLYPETDAAEIQPTAADAVPGDITTADQVTEAASVWTPEPIISHDLEITWAGMHDQPDSVSKVIAWAKDLRLPIAGDREGAPVFEDCFVYAAQPAALGITLSEAGQADRAGTLTRIRQLAVEVGIPAESLHLGGSPVATAALNQEVSLALWNPAAPWFLPWERSVIITSWMVGVGLTFWLLRDLRLTVIVLAVSYYVTLMSVALVPLCGSSMNMVLVVMPTLLLVVTMSGAVHLTHYWQNEAHRDPMTAIIRTVQTARFPCLLAAVTTSIGLGSLLTSRLSPVREFGFYSAVGTLFSVVVVLYAVPALLQIWPARTTVSGSLESSRKSWNRFGRWVLRYSTPICTVSAVATVACGFGLTRFRTETKVIKYFPVESQVVRDYAFVEDHVAGIIPVETVINFGAASREELNFSQRLEIVRQISDKIRQVPDVTGTLSLADFHPVAQTPGDEASMREKLSYNSRSAILEQKVLESPARGALLSVASQPTEFDHQGDELWRITSQVATLRGGEFRDLSAEIDLACRSVLKYHAGTQHVITGMVPLFLATQQEILESLINSFAMAFGLIAIVMIWSARSIVAGLMAMIPNVLPVVLAFGGISWAGMSVDVGTLITASVALGIAVDGTLHLITWYRNAILAGRGHRVAMVRALEHCGPALWQTSLALGLAMLVLAPSNLLLLSRFGWLMCSMIMLAMLADIVVTPAMLSGVMGRLIARAALAERRRLLKLVSEGDEEEDLLAEDPEAPVERASVVPPPHLLSGASPGDTIETAMTHRIDAGPNRNRRR